MFGTAMLIASAASAAYNAYDSYRTAQNQKDYLKKQKELQIKKANAQYDQAQNKYGLYGTERRSATASLAGQNSQIANTLAQSRFSLDQAKQQYASGMESLKASRNRAVGEINFGRQKASAQMGALGTLGGTIGSRIEDVQANQVDEFGQQYNQSEQQLEMGMERARTSHNFTVGQTNSRRQLNNYNYALANEKMDDAMDSARTGRELGIASADLSYNYQNNQISPAASLITGGLQGFTAGMQLGSSIYNFDQQFQLGLVS